MRELAVFFLAFAILTISLSFSLAVKSYAAGDNAPTPTPGQETKGGISVYGGAPIYGGEPVYGGGVISQREGEILIDKMVKNPSTGSFVDHLGPTDPKYRPLNIIVFQIRVNNPGDSELNVVNAVDTLPEFIDFMTGPGNYDRNTKKLTFQIEKLRGGETRVFELRARITHQANLPESKTVICPVNVIDASSGDIREQDESQFCIEKEMITPQIPQAGAETAVLALLGSALSAGLYLRKRTFKYQ